MEPTLKMVAEYGAQGLLLLAVVWLSKVVVYLNKKREEQEVQYVSLIREQAAVLAKIQAHLEDAHDE